MSGERKKIRAIGEYTGSLARFFEKEGISIAVTLETEFDVEVTEPLERRQSDSRTLYVGGWIACEDGRALSGRLSITIPEAGKLLDFLDVKVRDCGLGCF